MDLQLTNKIVIISGGARGIGAAIVREVAREGAIPVIVDEDEGAARRLQHELQNNGAASHVITAELSGDECSRVVEEAVRLTGRLDSLVNHGGMDDIFSLENESTEQYAETVKRPLQRYYDLTHYALPLLKQSRGCIVNVCSSAAITEQRDTSGYASSRGPVLALTREWAAELLPCGIRVNAVVPVDRTPMGNKLSGEEQIAAVVVFLISGRAGHITGQHLFVDGGRVRPLPTDPV